MDFYFVFSVASIYSLINVMIFQSADRAESSAVRLESAWHDRVRQQGFEASLFSVIWRFCRTRAVVATILMVLAVIFQFLGPVS